MPPAPRSAVGLSRIAGVVGFVVLAALGLASWGTGRW